MKINRVYIKNFGGISDREYILSDGLNVIFGENESGKSTFLSFIRFIFYGAKKSRAKELSFRDKYMPWSGEDMSGEIEFTSNSTEYSLSRTISATGRKKDVTFINKTTGDTLPVPDADEIGTELFKLSEDAFLKTLFLGAEGAQITSDGELLTKISNVSQSGDENISYQSICAQINNMIADLSSPRRNKAIIPALERQLEILKEKKEDAQILYEKKNVLSINLEEVTLKLDEAISTKTKLNDMIAKAKKYTDWQTYKKAGEKLKEAEQLYKNSLSTEETINAKYDFLNDITDEEEQIILKDNSLDISSAKTQEILLGDKVSTSKKIAILCIILSVISAIAGIFSPISFIGTAFLILFAVHFILSSKKFKREIVQITNKIIAAEQEKSKILKKYNLESTEHYKLLKRENADLSEREELNKSNSNALKEIYNGRKYGFDALTLQVIERYGSIENLECEKVDIDEITISEQIKSVDEKILNLTAERATIKNNINSAEDISQELTNIESEINYLNLSLKEANEKLRILNLATEILNQSYEELKGNFAPRLAKTTASIFNKLTGGKYGELIVNDEFQIQLKSDGKYEISKFFSSGTIQQLYFSLRLGIIELIMGNYPLFIDDAFITYDDSRFKNASDFLKDYSENNQIVFCTCHTRESNMQGAQVLKF